MQLAVASEISVTAPSPGRKYCFWENTLNVFKEYDKETAGLEYFLHEDACSKFLRKDNYYLHVK
jgi:hypothetical protein